MTTGVNKINHYPLRETLANAALSLLREGEDYTQLNGLSCTFGYLYEFEGHGVEALFYITTDRGCFYFAAQGSSLKWLDINKEQFQAYQQSFLEMHNSPEE